MSARRVLAAVLALAGLVPLWLGTWLSVIAISFGLETPDPNDPFEFGPPETRGQALKALAFGVPLAVATIAFCVFMGWLAQVALTGRTARPRPLDALRSLAVWLLLMVVAVAAIGGW